MAKISHHQWTNGGDKVLILKCVNSDRTSHGGFVWPESGKVKPKSWSDTPDCESGGLFGWAWGICFGDGKEPDYSGKWIVFSANPEDVVLLGGGKVKAACGEVVYCGSIIGAQIKIMEGRHKWIVHNAEGNTSSGDSSSAASSGDSSSAECTGNRCVASVSGDYATLETTGANSIAATTADTCYWIVHKGSVLVQRTEKGVWLLNADDLGLADGTKVTVKHGQIV